MSHALCVPYPPLRPDFRAVALGSWGNSVLLGDAEGTLAHWDTGAFLLPCLRQLLLATQGQARLEGTLSFPAT